MLFLHKVIDVFNFLKAKEHIAHVGRAVDLRPLDQQTRQQKQGRPTHVQ